MEEGCIWYQSYGSDIWLESKSLTTLDEDDIVILYDELYNNTQ